jgi:hypothetical protein
MEEMTNTEARAEQPGRCLCSPLRDRLEVEHKVGGGNKIEAALKKKDRQQNSPHT